MTLLLDQAPQKGAPHETTADLFEQDVLMESMKTPVVVDFWAPWCGPCKQLMPALEKAVANAKGAVKMVTVNIDKNPELAQIFRVQSVPMVYAFFQGQPVDGFMGARPDSELKAFVEKLAALGGAQPDTVVSEDGVVRDPEAAAKLVEEGDTFFSDGKIDEAMEKYALALDADPESAAALGAIGWCLLQQGDREGLDEMAQGFTPGQMEDARIKGLLFILETAKAAPGTPPPANADKLPALYDLALCDIADGDLGSAIDRLVAITRRDREWEDQKARKLLLGLFEAMGPRHPLTSQGRRKLSAVLFS